MNTPIQVYTNQIKKILFVARVVSTVHNIRKDNPTKALRLLQSLIQWEKSIINYKIMIAEEKLRAAESKLMSI